MSENKYMSFPEGYDQLADDLKMPMDDPQMKRFYLSFLVSTLANN